jgi:P27 family predicted phage terminase small subunit
MSGTFRSGRRHTPTALKALQGKKLRAGDHDSATYPTGKPDIPPLVSADPLLLEHWNRFADRLLDAGVLTTAHGEMLTLLVVAHTNYLRALEQFAQMGYQHLVVDEAIAPGGFQLRKIKVNPLKREIDRNANAVMRFLSEFGLTPVSAPKVPTQLARARREDPFELFLLKGKRG